MKAPRISPGNIYASRVKNEDVLLRVIDIKLEHTGRTYSSRSRSTHRTVYRVKNIRTGEVLRLNTARHFIFEVIPN